MKHARIVLDGIVHAATEAGPGLVRLPDGRVLAEDQVQWLPPIEPRTTFTLAINYADHAKELAFKAPAEPVGFLKAANTFVGHRARTFRPADVAFMHYECELAVVIGKTARNVRRDQAYDHVAGYTVANDYALRDYLENWYRPNLRVKSRDTCRRWAPGWWTATTSDPMNLTLSTHVNGVRAARQHARHGVRRARADRVLQQLHDALARRSDPDRHARRHRQREARRRGRDRNRRGGKTGQHPGPLPA